MSNVNFLKPNKENLNLFLFLGTLFFVLGLIDFCLNNFYEKNITNFLPGFISFFTPLIFAISIFGVVYASLTTIQQIDLKKIIAKYFDCNLYSRTYPQIP